MKTVELPDEVFQKLEALRRTKKLSRMEALAQAIDASLEREKLLQKWASRKPTPAAAELSEEEVERLAVEMVREARRSRRE